MTLRGTLFSAFTVQTIFTQYTVHGAHRAWVLFAGAGLSFAVFRSLDALLTAVFIECDEKRNITEHGLSVIRPRRNYSVKDDSRYLEKRDYLSDFIGATLSKTGYR